jgi:putative nucleotidyltransferase with HDIG domain
MERIRQLPLLPGAVVDLLRLKSSAPNYFERVVTLISGDPGFATKVLQFANSAASSPPHPIVKIPEALLRIGAERAVNLVVGHTAARVFVPREGWERDLWFHALDVAELMRALARNVRGAKVDADTAYLFGLLHDIGRFVLYLDAPEDLRAVDETEWGSPRQLMEAERAVMGFTHAELGSLAAAKWQLPRDLVVFIRHHHTPPSTRETVPAQIVPFFPLVQLADWVAISLSRHDGWREMTPVELHHVLAPALSPAVGLSVADLAAIARTALDRAAATREALGFASAVGTR